MKCQKCAKPAVVHLTEVVTPKNSAAGEGKRAVERHLCLSHAVEAGLLTPAAEPPAVALQPEGKVSGAPALEEEPDGAIVPAHVEPSGMVVARDRGGQQADPMTCPTCGMNWTQFKQGGLMGCAHDYEQFGGKLVPLLKRAQEGATEHVGKTPPRRKTTEGDRHVTTLRLRRELKKAVESEQYEQAATLRDKLKGLEG